jgi:Uncharacterized protein conserved in bacteria (DUF2130)
MNIVEFTGFQMPLKTVNARPIGGHTHEPNGSAGEARCPYCGQSITRQEFEKIRARIEAEERARIAKTEQALKDKFAREQQQAATKAKAEIEKAKKDAAAQIDKAKQEGAAREAVIRQQATKAATAALAPKIAEAVNTEKERSYAERLKLAEQLDDMKRRLEKKTAGELGDEAEVNLLDMLKREFGGDQIAGGDVFGRTPKGRNGADIIHQVVHNGTVCGTIIYEAKNHKRWLNSFTTKLRQDQIAEQADHAVLVSAVFPAGAQQLAVRDGVVIVHPARVIALAHLLRRQTVQLHRLRLGNEARAGKTERLYEFMTSDRASHLWDQIADATNELEVLERSEKISHEKTWGRRADLIRHLKEAHHSFGEAIERVIGATGSELSS